MRLEQRQFHRLRPMEVALPVAVICLTPCVRASLASTVRRALSPGSGATDRAGTHGRAFRRLPPASPLPTDPLPPARDSRSNVPDIPQAGRSPDRRDRASARRGRGVVTHPGLPHPATGRPADPEGGDEEQCPRDRQARGQGQPGGSVHVVLYPDEEVAPGRGRRLDAEAQERDRRLSEDRAAELHEERGGCSKCSNSQPHHASIAWRQAWLRSSLSWLPDSPAPDSNSRSERAHSRQCKLAIYAIDSTQPPTGWPRARLPLLYLPTSPRPIGTL